MINYNWDCRTVDVYLEKDDYTNVVYNVHWSAVGEDSNSGIKADNIGVQWLNTDDITDFISIEDLTNAQLVEWVKAALGEENVLNIENSIAELISEKENPVSITMTIEN